VQGTLSQVNYPIGRVVAYNFDSVGRLDGLQQVEVGNFPAVDLVTGASYNKAGQPLTMDFLDAVAVRETRTYDSLLQQLTRIQVAAMAPPYTAQLDLEYQYPASPNSNGRITAETDNLTGTTVSYAYDQLNRLSGATSVTGGTTNWGLSFSYDVYGNRTAQAVTAGTAPAFSASFDNNNRMVGYSYDNNGNQLNTPDGATLTYDWDNRMTSWSSGGASETYHYHPAGWRIWKKKSTEAEGTLYLYGPGGQLLHERSDSGSAAADYIYFGGRLLYTARYQSGTWTRTGMYVDRLGTVRAAGGVPRNYYPFGEEITSTSNNDYKFASTYRDSTTGLDYAVNRYYASAAAHFLTPDPYQASGGAAVPQNWNRYAYVHNDPVNYFDPSGTNEADPNDPGSSPGGTNPFGVWGFYSVDPEGKILGQTIVGGTSPAPGPSPSGSTGGMPSEDPDQRAILNKGLARAKDLIKKSECAGLFSTGNAAKDLQALIDSKPAPSVAAIAQSALSRNAGFGTASQAATSILGGMATTIEYSEDFNAKVWLGGQNVTFSSLYLSRVIGGLNSMDDLTVTVLHEALHSLGVDHGGGRTYGTPADMDKAIKENCLQ
jgi:RHS repeat-associated protein